MNELLYPLGKTLVLPWSSSISTEKDTESYWSERSTGHFGSRELQHTQKRWCTIFNVLVNHTPEFNPEILKSYFEVTIYLEENTHSHFTKNEVFH